MCSPAQDSSSSQSSPSLVEEKTLLLIFVFNSDNPKIPKKKMSATLTSSSLLQIPPLQRLKKLSISTSFLHGSSPLPFHSKPSPSAFQTPNFLPSIRAMRSLQGRVVCATNDKTVAVEVVRLAPHPKYKRRIRIKKKYQAHDPDNQFKVGDFVELEKCRPISKMKTFLAIPVPERSSKKKAAEDGDGELGIPLESQQEQV
ncbi:30S ribosomal protein S17, chloroplastic [Benincasa hispida]|uniref:30S ribosomal protein S17, chloroplastic n=1 Tax=Benincasa hispida TaxID=102211 RepID=UPI0018FF73D2|nr:30S ribosomal protein S17, chloroplastic [Benincasa hispida]